MSRPGVSFWWRDIGVPERRPALDGDAVTEVCIVGAGYTGLWTAIAVKDADPSVDVLVIEAEHAGFGASGRNGGWLTNSITGGRASYARDAGKDAANALQRAANDTVDAVVEFCTTEGIDADLAVGGELVVARSVPQEQRLRAFAAGEAAWPHTDGVLLEWDALRERVDIAGARAGFWHPHCARLHPAKLARGLAEAAERRGVRIVEGTRVTAIEPGLARSERGDVRARFVLRATEGFTAQLRGAHREILPMNSSMIITEPLPASAWDAIGWRGIETIGDMAHVYMYAQRTADGRIALGGRGYPYRWASGIDDAGGIPRSTVEQLARVLHRMFPAARGARIADAWSGVLGVPRDWRASVGLGADGVGWAGGYVGTGVASTYLAGHTLADLVLGRDTERTRLPWVGRRARDWEPEPARWIAVHGLYAAYGVADRLEERGSATSPIARVADLITGRGH